MILALNELVHYNHVRLSETNAVRLKWMLLDAEQYNRMRWFTRISTGFSLHADLERVDDTVRLSFPMEDVFVFVGYDVGDWLTLQLGLNVATLQAVSIGISVDLSTPVMAWLGTSTKPQ